jgi:hypothetical protein
MTSTRKRGGTKNNDPAQVLVQVVERHRKRSRMSLRAAADRAGISESTWRQLVAGGVNVAGRWVNRMPRRDQVLDMAMAVGCLEEAATALGAEADEVMESRTRVILIDPAEEEIMALRHLRPAEKLRLIEELQRLRDE